MPLQEQPNPEAIKKALLVHVPAAKQDFLATFLEGILKLYRGLNFAYMEVNPLVREIKQACVRSCVWMVGAVVG